MQAANEVAKEAGAPGSIGIRVELPFDQDMNPMVDSRLALAWRVENCGPSTRQSSAPTGVTESGVS
jgi:hypothetical protein